MAEHKHKMVNARFNAPSHWIWSDKTIEKYLILPYRGPVVWMMCSYYGCMYHNLFYHRDLIKPTTE